MSKNLKKTVIKQMPYDSDVMQLFPSLTKVVYNGGKLWQQHCCQQGHKFTSEHFCDILNKLLMHSWQSLEFTGWFCQHFGKLKRESVSYGRYKPAQSTGSSVNLSKNTKETSSLSSANVSGDKLISSGFDLQHTDCTHSTALSTPSLSSCPCSSPSLSSLCSTPLLPSALRAPFRFTCSYDVCVCHSDKNISQANGLVSFLESPAKGLRCYLQSRDSCLGGALSTELCKAIQTSHCWVLLLTPSFLQDEWCLYQMQQVISEAPMSQRIIPTVLDMRISEIPLELRFFYSVDLSCTLEAGYAQVYRTVLQYLKDMCKREELSPLSQTEGHKV